MWTDRGEESELIVLLDTWLQFHYIIEAILATSQMYGAQFIASYYLASTTFGSKMELVTTEAGMSLRRMVRTLGLTKFACSFGANSRSHCSLNAHNLPIRSPGRKIGIIFKNGASSIGLRSADQYSYPNERAVGISMGIPNIRAIQMSVNPRTFILSVEMIGTDHLFSVKRTDPTLGR